jgi:hypothetical protein
VTDRKCRYVCCTGNEYSTSKVLGPATATNIDSSGIDTTQQSPTKKKKRSNVQREKKMECSTVASPTFDASAPFVRFIVLIDISFVRPIHKNNSIWNTVHHFRESIRIFLLVLDNEETQRQLSLHKDGRFLLLYLGFA